MAKGTEAHVPQLQNITIELPNVDMMAILRELEAEREDVPTAVVQYLKQLASEPNSPSPLLSSDIRLG